MSSLKTVIDAANPINLADALKQINLGTLINNLASVVTETVSSVTGDLVVLKHRPIGAPFLVQVSTTPKAPMIGTVAAGKYTYDPATKTVQLYASEGGATTYIRYATLETPTATATLAIDSAAAINTTLAAAFPAAPTR